jgi:hypothetical protein
MDATCFIFFSAHYSLEEAISAPTCLVNLIQFLDDDDTDEEGGGGGGGGVLQEDLLNHQPRLNVVFSDTTTLSEMNTFSLIPSGNFKLDLSNCIGEDEDGNPFAMVTKKSYCVTIKKIFSSFELDLLINK